MVVVVVVFVVVVDLRSRGFSEGPGDMFGRLEKGAVLFSVSRPVTIRCLSLCGWRRVQTNRGGAACRSRSTGRKSRVNVTN